MIAFGALPPSNLLYVAGSKSTLQPWLKNILGRHHEGFVAVTAVAEAPVSGRVLTLATGIGVAPLREPMTPEQAAEEIFRLSENGEARYREAHEPGTVKGWEVREANIFGKPAAVLFASWVHPRPDVASGERQEPPPQPGE